MNKRTETFLKFSELFQALFSGPCPSLERVCHRSANGRLTAGLGMSWHVLASEPSAEIRNKAWNHGLTKVGLALCCRRPHQGPGAKQAIKQTPGRPENNQIGFQDQGPKTIPGQAQKQSKMSQSNPNMPKNNQKMSMAPPSVAPRGAWRPGIDN